MWISARVKYAIVISLEIMNKKGNNGTILIYHSETMHKYRILKRLNLLITDEMFCLKNPTRIEIFNRSAVLNNFPHLNILINFSEKAKPFQRNEIFVIIFYF